MCNFLYNGSPVETIPESGIGYKIFSVPTPGSILSGIDREPYYRKNKQGWIFWDNSLPGDGFCFFDTKEEAEFILTKWRSGIAYQIGKLPLKLFKIQYARGLGKRIEPAMIFGVKPTVSLCKSFKVIEEG